MNQRREAGGTAERSIGPAHRLAALRGELWERHATLRTLNAGNAEYQDASARLLDLTSQLLGLEAEAAADSQPSHRRAGHIGFAVASLLLAVAVALAVAAPALGAPIAAVAAGSILLLAVLVFAATWWVHHRSAAPGRADPADRSDAVRSGPVPDTGPDTGPDTEPYTALNPS